jgi:hypothetical protein
VTATFAFLIPNPAADTVDTSSRAAAAKPLGLDKNPSIVYGTKVELNIQRVEADGEREE